MTGKIITIEQLANMRHAIGYKFGNEDDNRIYHAYRNHFGASKENPSWESLVELGYASKRYLAIFNETVYYVSAKGMIYMSELYGITIKY